MSGAVCVIIPTPAQAAAGEAVLARPDQIPSSAAQLVRALEAAERPASVTYALAMVENSRTRVWERIDSVVVRMPGLGFAAWWNGRFDCGVLAGQKAGYRQIMEWVRDGGK